MKIAFFIFITSLFYTSVSADQLKLQPIDLNKKSTAFYEKVYFNFKKMGGDKTALNQALCFFSKNKKIKFQSSDDSDRAFISLDNDRYLTIQDLTKNSTEARLFIIDMQTGDIQSTFSSHGAGKTSEEFWRNFYTAEETSNEPDSHLTPRGFFITGRHYQSSEWPAAMRLYGLQKGINDNSFARAIVLHSYPKRWEDNRLFSSNEENRREDYTTENPMSLSWGCTMISPVLAPAIIAQLEAPAGKGGSLYYNYSNIEKKYGDSYCGDEGLLKK